MLNARVSRALAGGEGRRRCVRPILASGRAATKARRASSAAPGCGTMLAFPASTAFVTPPDNSPPAPLRLRRVVPVLGIAQIISVGTAVLRIGVLGSGDAPRLGERRHRALRTASLSGFSRRASVAPGSAGGSTCAVGAACSPGGSALGALACGTRVRSGTATLMAGWLRLDWRWRAASTIPRSRRCTGSPGRRTGRRSRR